jgi:hypothetical protein
MVWPFEVTCNGLPWAVQQRGHLVIAEVGAKTQGEQRPGALRQTLHLVEQVGVADLPQREGLDVLHHRPLLAHQQLFPRDVPPRCGPPSVAGHVDHDPPQPGLDASRAVAVELWQRAHGFQQRVLRKVLRVGLVPADHRREPEDTAAVLVCQLLRRHHLGADVHLDHIQETAAARSM